jgi:hypothetical protein
VCALLCTIQLGFLSPAIEQLRGELEQVLGGGGGSQGWQKLCHIGEKKIRVTMAI